MSDPSTEAFLVELHLAARELARISLWLRETAPHIVDGEGKPAAVARSMLLTVAASTAHGSRELSGTLPRLPVDFRVLPKP